MEAQPCQASALTDYAVTLSLCWCAPAAQMDELPLFLTKEGSTNGSSCYNDLTLLRTPVRAWFVSSFRAPVVFLDKMVGVCAQHFLIEQRPSREAIIQRLYTGFAIRLL